MRVIAQFLLIPVLLIASHYTSLLTYSLVRNLKNGYYVTPIFGWRFDNWPMFIVASLGAFQPFYWLGGVLLFSAYKLSMDYFSEMYPVVILNLVAVTSWTILMMYIKVREVPTRDGWIALVLIIIVSLLAINAGKNINPH